MGYTLDILEEIRTNPELLVTDDSLTEARERREAVKSAALRFRGTLRPYNSGSLAHRTATRTADGDCGVVLDRRQHTTLGPDSSDEDGPNDIVEEVRAHVEDELRGTYPDVTATTTGQRRSILVEFHDPADGHGDPSVDLIVGLTRKDAAGIWIPNLKARCWNESDPECHTKLLTANPKALRVMRARVIRLMKAQVRQWQTPTMCSFNVAALALSSVTNDAALDEALMEFLEYAAADLAAQLTPDPAGVSPPINLPLMQSTAVDRLERARDDLREALDNDDDHDVVQTALARVFPDYVEVPNSAPVGQHVAALVRGGKRALVVAAGYDFPKKSTRAYGPSRE